MSVLQHLIDAAVIHERFEKMAHEISQLKAENNQLRFHLNVASNSLEFFNSRFESQRNEFLRPCSELINSIYECIDRIDENRENNTQLEITTASNNQTRNVCAYYYRDYIYTTFKMISDNTIVEFRT